MRMRYQGEHTSQISFPLGGIGTGCVGLSGNGQLVDFELFGRPNKKSLNGYTGLAIKAENAAGVRDARVLCGDFPAPYTGDRGLPGVKHSGYGFGPSQYTLAGLPHFRDWTFDGRFPIAGIDFREEAFPGDVRLTAWNPFIPLNDKDSGIPAAFFEVEIENNTPETLDYTVCFFLSSPHPIGDSHNRATLTESARMVTTMSEPSACDILRHGEMTIATDCAVSAHQTYWYRGGWQDNIEMFWTEFTEPGLLKDRAYPRGEHPGCTHRDVACVEGRVTVPGGERAAVRFVLAWHYPQMYNFWHPEPDGQRTIWAPYYATVWRDSREAAAYCLAGWDRLFAGTRLFQETLHGSTLPEAVIDAVSANLAVLISPTVLRLADGTFYGFEGCLETEGSCEGSCTHVWNYAYALAFLFPALERGMREADFRYNQRADGRMSFRLMLPPGRARQDFRACVDGQMGGVVKAYRDWKISGDDGWLRTLWPAVKMSLEYAWAETNEDKWDPEKRGVMTGRQHHTLDMELFGANAWLTGFYLAALKAGAEMAGHLGETDAAAQYRAIFARGKAWADAHLFNGEYYAQAVDLKDQSLLSAFGTDAVDTYWNAERGEMKYQIGSGCLIDQVIAAWHANLCGLGEIFDPAQVRTALKSLYQYNFKRMREVANVWRNYALNDEQGLLICTWPQGAKPAVPLTYATECMTGFEYQAACHMIQEGLLEEGLSVVRQVRDRYDGRKRNPWNEMECGSNYARSMASYSLLPALSGFSYDMGKGYIGFDPQINADDFRCFWSLGTGWGRFSRDTDGLELTVLAGELRLTSLGTGSFALSAPERCVLLAKGREIPYVNEHGTLRFAEIAVRAGESLRFMRGRDF